MSGQPHQAMTATQKRDDTQSHVMKTWTNQAQPVVREAMTSTTTTGNKRGRENEEQCKSEENSKDGEQTKKRRRRKFRPPQHVRKEQKQQMLMEIASKLLQTLGRPIVRPAQASAPVSNPQPHLQQRAAGEQVKNQGSAVLHPAHAAISNALHETASHCNTTCATHLPASTTLSCSNNSY